MLPQNTFFTKRETSQQVSFRPVGRNLLGAMLVVITLLALNILPLNILHAQTCTTPSSGEVDIFTSVQNNETFTVCGDAHTFEVAITNTTAGQTLSAIVLHPNMPDGMEYIAGSAAGMAETDISDPNNPVLTLNTTLAAGQDVTVTFDARATCGMIAFLRQQFPGQTDGTANNETVINYTGSTSGAQCFAEPNGSESYNIIFGGIEIFIPTADKTQSADNGAEVTRTVTIQNSGVGAVSSLELEIDYPAELQSPVLELNGNPITPSGVVGTKLTYTITDFDGTPGDLLEQNENIDLTERVTVLGCSPSLNTLYTVRWGCTNSSGVDEICNENDQEAATNAFVNVINGEPSFALSKTFPVTTDFCSGNPGKVELTYTNNGSGNGSDFDRAENMVVQISTQSGVGTLSNFRIKHLGSGAFVPLSVPSGTSATINLATLGENIDGTGGLEDIDGDGFSDLPAGTTVTISADITLSCPAAFSTCPGNTSLQLLSSHINYEDNCGEPRNNVQNNTTPFSSTLISNEITGPVDLLDGQSGVFTFTVARNEDRPALINCSSGSFFSEITVPAGYQATAASFNGNAITPVQTGNVLTLNDGGFNGSYEVTFTIDCGAGAGSNSIANIEWDMFHRCSPGCSPVDACDQHIACSTFEVFNHCDDCPGFHTTSFEAVRTTFGWEDPVDGAYTVAELNSGTIPLADENTPGINLDDLYPGDNFRATATGILTADAGVSYNANEVFVEISYLSPLSTDLFEFGSANTGEFIVNGTSYPFTGPVTSSVVTGNKVVYTFSLADAPGATGVVVNPGDDIDLIANFTVKKQTGLSTGVHSLANRRFRAEHYGDKGSGRQACESFGDIINVLVPSVGTSQPFFVWECNPDPGALARNPAVVYVTMQTAGGVGVDDFPAEFRPLAHIKEATITIPEGFALRDNSAFILARPGISVPLGTPDVTNVVNGKQVITWTEKPDWVVREFNGGNVSRLFDNPYRIQLNIDPVCSDPPVPVQPSQVVENASGKLTTFEYLRPQGGEEEANFSTPYRFFNSRINNRQLTADNIQDGIDQLVTWPIQLSNFTGRTNAWVVNPWIAFESEDPNVILVGIMDDNGKMITQAGAEPGIDPLLSRGQITFYGDNDQHMLFTLPYNPFTQGESFILFNNQLQSLKLVAQTINCEDDVIADIDVFSSMTCLQENFPAPDENTITITDIETDCEYPVEEDLLQLRFKTADMQVTVEEQTTGPVDLCAPVPYEVVITSAKFANLNNVQFELELPDGVQLENGTASFTYKGTTSDEIPDPGSLVNMPLWDISGIALSNFGGVLRGTNANAPGDDENNFVIVNFSLVPNCDFNPGEAIIFRAMSMTNCSDNLEFTAQQKINLVDFTPDDLTMDLSAGAFDGCIGPNGFNDVEVELTNNSLSDASGVEQLQVVIPPGINYVPGSANVAESNIDQPTINDPTVVTWDLPAGFIPSNNGVKTITFQTQITNAALYMTTVNYSATTTQNGSATCVADQEECDLIATTSSDNQDLFINLEDPIIDLTTTATLPVCAGTVIDLTANVSYTSGNPPAGAPVFAWALGIPDTDNNATVTVNQATTYTVTVTDARGCSATDDLFADIAPPATITLNTITPASCDDADDGALDFSVSTASSLVDLDVKLFDNSDNTQVGSTINVTMNNTTITDFNALLPGTYRIEVTDNETGCVRNQLVTINDGGPVANACATLLSCGAGSGDVTFGVTVTRQRDGQTGTFTYEVLDDMGMTVSAGTGNGNIGSTTPAELLVQGISTGTYTVVVTDDNGCTATDEVEVEALTFNVGTLNPQGQIDNEIELCYEEEGRDIDVVINTNETNCLQINNFDFTYELEKDGETNPVQTGSGTVSTGGTFTLPGLTLGSYTLTVTPDAPGAGACEVVWTFDLTSMSTFTVELETTDPLCFGEATGSASVQVFGGDGNIIYQWIELSDPNTVLSSNASVAGLFALVDYGVIVSDARGCADPEPLTFQLNEPEELGDITIEDLQNCTGRATLENTALAAPGGVEPYRFDWFLVQEEEVLQGDPPGGGQAGTVIEETLTLQFSETVADGISEPDKLLTGTYEVVVTDANGCTVSQRGDILQPDVVRSYQICFNWKSNVEQAPATPVNTSSFTINSGLAATSLSVSLSQQVDECVRIQQEAVTNGIEQTCFNEDNVEDEVRLNYSVHYTHFTLFYYDRAGNLVQTVPPEGVELVNPIERVPTTHTMRTTYKYNSLGQLIEQNTPDGGRTFFRYNDLNQLRYSQNARQVDETTDGTYSYTNYDKLGRIVEVGKSDLTGTGATFNGLPVTGNPIGDQSEQTFTVYSDPAKWISYQGEQQRFLRNRVSHTYTINKPSKGFAQAGTPANPLEGSGDTVLTVFSYDPHGNVEWLVSDVQGFGQTTVEQEFDLISGNVLEVKFNKGRTDGFTHRYAYDEDNRIVDVYTTDQPIPSVAEADIALQTIVNQQSSVNTFDNDAHYEYYDHGPLQRTEIGEDNIQGVDYVYTIQGWLKGINSPDLDPANDVGGDGSPPVGGVSGGGDGFSTDEFGMELTYFEGDYNRTGASFGQAPYRMPNITNLYNGNIASWTSRTRAELEPSNEHENTLTGHVYRYDRLNRIRSANFGHYDDGSGVWSMTTEYNTSYTYDGNGNILTLQRNGNNASGLTMDDLTYTYMPGTNKLLHVDDIADPAAYGNDIDDQAANNYVYDGIGNMTRDESEGITIEWNVYGKVAQVIPDQALDPEDQKPHIVFSYDALGNRVKKQLNTDPQYDDMGNLIREVTNPEAIKTTYYARDASGNIMAVYKRENEQIGEPFLSACNGGTLTGFENLSGSGEGGDLPDACFTGPAVPTEDCSSCTAVTNNETIAAGTKRCVLSSTTFNGNITLDGGTLVVCGDYASGNININFDNGGKIVVLETGSITVPNLHLNNTTHTLENHGTVVVDNMTVGGGSVFDNFGAFTLNVSDLNVSGTASTFNNFGTATINTSVNNNGLFLNEGAVVIANNFNNNSGSQGLTNRCTMDIGGELQNNAVIDNEGEINVTTATFVNSGSTLTMHSGSTFTTTDLQVNGTIENADTEGCASVSISGATTLNSGAVINGNVDICDAGGDIIDNGATFSGGATSDCSCDPDAEPLVCDDVYKASIKQIEVPIYGSDRIGQFTAEKVVHEEFFELTEFSEVSMMPDVFTRKTELDNILTATYAIDELNLNTSGGGGGGTAEVGACFQTPFTSPVNCSSGCTRTISGSGNETINSGEQVCIADATAFTGTVNLNGGHLVVCGDLLPVGVNNWNGGEVTVTETGTFDWSGNLELYGTITVSNYGDLSLGALTVGNNNTLTNYSTLTVSGNVTTNGGGLIVNECTIDAGGTTQLYGTGITNRGTFTANTLNVGGGSVLEMDEALVQATTLDVTGTINGTGTGCSSVEIDGTTIIRWGSSIDGSVDICDADGIETNEPGASVFTNGATADCSCELGGTDPPPAGPLSLIRETHINVADINTSTLTSQVNFIGETGNAIVVAERVHSPLEGGQGGDLQFYATVADYWGQSNTLLIYDKENNLISGLGAQSFTYDPASKPVVVKRPCFSQNVIASGSAAISDCNEEYLLFARTTTGDLVVHTIDMDIQGFGTVADPLGAVTSTNVIPVGSVPLPATSGFGRHLAVAEDYRKGKAYVFASTHNNTSHTTTLTRFTITETEIQPAEVLTTYESFDELGQGEIQISPDGKRLSIYNHKVRLGFFAHQEVEVLTMTLSTDFEVVEENNLIQNNRTTVPYGNLSAGQAGLPKGSVEFTQTSDAVYFNQEALVNFAENNTTNKLNYKQSLKDGQATLLAYLPEMKGDLRRSADGEIYFFNKDADNAAVFADDITFTGSPATFTHTETFTGAVSHQPHRVFRNEPVTITTRRIVGAKQYQHSDHLGSVRVVYSDVKIRVTDGAGTLLALEAEIESYSNFYSFGQAQPSRSFASEKVRYGFNGKEKDSEWNSDVVYDYGFRIYDPRLARFLSVDPLSPNTPWLTPYALAENQVIWAIDVDGLKKIKINFTDANGVTHRLVFDTKRPQIVKIDDVKIKFDEGSKFGSHSIPLLIPLTTDQLNTGDERANAQTVNVRAAIRRRGGIANNLEGSFARRGDKAMAELNQTVKGKKATDILIEFLGSDQNPGIELFVVGNVAISEEFQRQVGLFRSMGPVRLNDFDGSLEEFTRERAGTIKDFLGASSTPEVRAFSRADLKTDNGKFQISSKSSIKLRDFNEDPQGITIFFNLKEADEDGGGDGGRQIPKPRFIK